MLLLLLLLLLRVDVQVSALIHTANRDYKSLIEDLVALEVLPKDTDRGQVGQSCPAQHVTTSAAKMIVIFPLYVPLLGGGSR